MHQQEVVNTGEYYWSCLNRSQNSQGTCIWLLASSFSDPALACRTLRVSTASVSTLILKSSSQKQLTWQAREALAFKSFIDSLHFKEKMTIIPKEIFQTNMLRASTWNISSVLIWEMWWRVSGWWRLGRLSKSPARWHSFLEKGLNRAGEYDVHWYLLRDAHLIPCSQRCSQHFTTMTI